MAQEAEPDSDDLPLITFMPNSARGIILEGGDERQAAAVPEECSLQISTFPSPLLKPLSISTVTKAVAQPHFPETVRPRHRLKHTFERLIRDNLMDASSPLGEEGFWDSALRPRQSFLTSDELQEGNAADHIRKKNGGSDETGSESEERQREQIEWLLNENYGLTYEKIPSLMVEGEEAGCTFTPPFPLLIGPGNSPSPSLTSIGSLSLGRLASLFECEYMLTVDMAREGWRILMMLAADRNIYERRWRHLHQMLLSVLRWLDGSRLEELLPTWIQPEDCSIYEWRNVHPLLVLDFVALLGDTVPGQVAAIIILDTALVPLREGKGETATISGSDSKVFLQWLTHAYLSLSGGSLDLCLLYRLTLLANARLHRTPLSRCQRELEVLLAALMRVKTGLPRASPALTLLSIRVREALGHMEVLLRTLTSKMGMIEGLLTEDPS